jgi:hypothetical protein
MFGTMDPVVTAPVNRKSTLSARYDNGFRKAILNPALNISDQIGSPNHLLRLFWINGIDFIIEYDNVGWLKDGNHIHSIWREKGNDFGEDLLKNHYKTHKH